MSTQKFLAWVQAAPPAAAAAAAERLAQGFLYGGLPERQRQSASLALAALLDHPSAAVRTRLAGKIADANEAPPHLVLALAHDCPEVAAIVLARSPVLADAELIERIAVGGAAAQMAIAARPCLSAAVAAALAEVGCLDAIIRLAANPGAGLLESAMRRMIERFGAKARLRTALLARGPLPSAIVCDLAQAAASALVPAARARGYSPEAANALAREARERAVIKTAAGAASEPQEMARLARHLHAAGWLTAGLLLRALLCGHKELLEFALAELSGVSMPRVIARVRRCNGAQFARLYRRAGMPMRLLPVFRAGLEALASDDACGGRAGARLKRPLIQRVLYACASINTGSLDHIFAALRCLDAQAAREEAREALRAAILAARREAHAKAAKLANTPAANVIALAAKRKNEGALIDVGASVSELAA